MASLKKNLQSLFTNTRTRVVMIFTLVLFIIAIIVGYFKFTSSTGEYGTSSANIGRIGNIESIPGQVNPNPEYVKLLQQENINQAKEAEEKGVSAIPTIVKTQTIKQGAQSLTTEQGGPGFVSLARRGEGEIQKELWIQTLKENHCTQDSLQKIIDEGAAPQDLKSVCTCLQLKQAGFSLQNLKDVCSCPDLKKAGVTVVEMKTIGFTAGQLLDCGFSACETKAAGFSAVEMKDGGYSEGELKGAGFSTEAIAEASGIPEGMTAKDIQKAGCDVNALKQLRAAGVSAAAIRRISGCSATQLKAAGYTADELKRAGFSAAELKKAGFSPSELKAAGFSAKDLLDAQFSPDDLIRAGFDPKEVQALATKIAEENKNLPKDCDVNALRLARLNGISAKTIKDKLGCDAAALKAAGYTASALKEAGYTPAELKRAGFTAKDLKDAGFTAKELADAGFSANDLKDAGFTAKQLKEAGFSANDLKKAGFSPKQLKDAGFDAKALKEAGISAGDLRNVGFDAKALKDAGFSPKDLHDAGFTAAELKDAGFSADDLKKAGYSPRDLKRAGFTNDEIKNAGYSANELRGLGISTVQGLNGPKGEEFTSNVLSVPSRTPEENITAEEAANTRQLQDVVNAQNRRLANQQYQQQIQQRTSEMLGVANTAIQNWSKVSTQVYTSVAQNEGKKIQEEKVTTVNKVRMTTSETVTTNERKEQRALIKTGDILFAVIDTAVDSDEPGPILATIVSNKFKGAKLIGSFVLPPDATKMVITFNIMSVPSAAGSTSISAYAIDPNTARTNLASSVNSHYFLRYGSLFASSFLEGFGNAFQSANTTVTVGGTGGGGQVTVQNGIGRSALENAVIGLATVGKNWGQFAQQQFNRPPTVKICSGTPIGVLFTQDLVSL